MNSLELEPGLDHHKALAALKGVVHNVEPYPGPRYARKSQFGLEVNIALSQLSFCLRYRTSSALATSVGALVIADE
jgi:hypothetical protein